MTELINIADIKKAYFIGIGGIGMSALARFFHARGVFVSGYDKSPTDLTNKLVEEGIQINFIDDISFLPVDADVVVYTPAIPSNNKIINHCREVGMNLMKRSDLLQIVSRDTFNICIAGTHGKTTISTMMAHILRHTGYGCNAFLGGIASNYDTNFWSDPRPVCVIEADEYDRSFLKLHPNVIAISSMDPDHLDIYGTADEMENSFIQFTGNLKVPGLLITKKGLKREADLVSSEHLTYHLDNVNADIHCKSLKIVDGSYHYDVQGNNWQINGLKLNMGGMHNVENSLVAISIAMHLGIDIEKIKLAVDAFLGVKRRFEFIAKTTATVYIDDYAHHPEELRALITGARALYPDNKMTVVFQPHLFTRTRDFADGFAESLDLADQVWILPIYPARELPIEGVDSAMIASKMKKPVVILDATDVLSKITLHNPEILITAGAGDIDKLIQPIKEQLILNS
jgi:UDP-N-acetylmuramate--alanine ligase